VNTQILIEDIHYTVSTTSDEEFEILRGVTLEIKAGSFVGILGENGSGKTTLLRHINGILFPSQGRVLVNGMDTRQPENFRRIRSLVGMVFQNPENQIVASTVEEDIAFGLENKNLPTKEIQKAVAEQLIQSGLEDAASHPPHLLSGGQIQRLALAGVLARQPQVILFDEPTSMLDPVTRRDFINHLFQLRDRGITIIYVTHHPEEVTQADQIVVLQKGKVKLCGTPMQVFQQEKILYEMHLDVPPAQHLAGQFRSIGLRIPAHVMNESDLIHALPTYQRSQHLQQSSTRNLSSDYIISAHDVHYTYLSGTPLARKALTGANLDVTRYHIHGIAGLNGSGKSTLLQHLNGILRPDKGTIKVEKLQLHDSNTPLLDVVRKVGLVFQSPESQFFEVYVGDEIAYGPKQFKLTDLRDRVKEAMTQVGLDFNRYKDRRLDTLSGGEKRKVALASTLVLNQDILLFDEPTAGMDPHSRREALALFHKLSALGKTIVISSHQLDELALVSQALSLMQNGCVMYTSSKQANLFDVNSLTDAGLRPPISVLVSQALVRKGWPLAGLDTSTPERLINAVRGMWL